MTAHTLSVTEAAVSELHTYHRNPRRGDVAAIAQSLVVNGQYRPIVVNAGTHTGRRNEVLAGNHTLIAARDVGWATIQVVTVDVDDDQAARIVAADNRTADLGEYDEAMLVELLSDMADLSGTGFTDADLAAMLDNTGDGDDAGPVTDLVYPHETIADEATRHYRAAGFPYPNMPAFVAMQEINALAATDTELLTGTNTAYHVADPYQPHRFTTPVQGKYTPVEAFSRDDKFRHALMLTLEGGKLNDSSLLGTLGYVRNAQCAAQFRPGFALLMYRRFAPADGCVLDTSTGFGGRLIGFLASKCSTYIGVDPNTATHKGNKQLAADLCPDGKTVELHCMPAEDVPHDTVAGRADFAFTSPPYFAKELYSEEPTQSHARYSTGDAWRDGFLLPTLALQYAALKPGGHSCVNIADVTISGETYPLVDWTRDTAQAAGFEHVGTERFPLSRAPGRGEAMEAFEAVVVLRKPGKTSENRFKIRVL